VNVPSARKMDEPRYGTEPPDAIPLLALPAGVSARVLAGECRGTVGPFKTVTEVQMVDYSLPEAASVQHSVPPALDNALVFCYRGSGSVSGSAVKENTIVLLDAASDVRDFRLEAGRCVRPPKRLLACLLLRSSGACFIVFAGKRLRQPIAWRGPFVMTTQVCTRRQQHSQPSALLLRMRFTPP
jgi:redox-sensitive bicupin YhaK (pirin superfamily)